MTRRDVALATMAAVLWGFNLIAGKIGVEAAPTLFFTALRFAVVAILVVPFFLDARRHWRPLFVLSVCLERATLDCCSSVSLALTPPRQPSPFSLAYPFQF